MGRQRTKKNLMIEGLVISAELYKITVHEFLNENSLWGGQAINTVIGATLCGDHTWATSITAMRPWYQEAAAGGGRWSAAWTGSAVNWL